MYLDVDRKTLHFQYTGRESAVSDDGSKIIFSKHEKTNKCFLARSPTGLCFI